jgi:hypothetical protein
MSARSVRVTVAATGALSIVAEMSAIGPKESIAQPEKVAVPENIDACGPGTSINSRVCVDSELFGV